MKRRQPLSLNALRAFEAAARLGRLTTAASELGVTHGAVSRQVKQLEAYLGVDLIAGSRARPELTDAGAALLAATTPAFDRIDDAVRMLKADEDGVLHVGCLSSFAVRWLIPRLHRFADAHPGVDVRLGTSLETQTAARGTFDLLITVLQPNAPIRSSDKVLFQERIGVVVAPALLSGDKPNPSRPRRLVARTRPDAWAEWEALAGRDSHVASTHTRPPFEHYHFAIQAALSGLGACVAPWHLVADDIVAGRLMAPFAFKETGYRYVLRGIHMRKRKAARFAAWLAKELAITLDARAADRRG